MHRLVTALLAGGSLAAGFALAQASGLRWLGAVVVLAGAAWCVARSVRTTAVWRLAVVLAAGAVCFVLSHVLAGALTAWGSVAVVSVVLAAATWLLVDDRQRDRQRD